MPDAHIEADRSVTSPVCRLPRQVGTLRIEPVSYFSGPGWLRDFFSVSH